MAEYGEWTRKGATLSHVTAKKEYGVGWDFIAKGIQAGKLEYREGSMQGNPYIAEELGAGRLAGEKKQTALRKIKKDIASLKKRLKELEARKTELESEMGQ